MILFFLQIAPKPFLIQITNKLPTFKDLVSTYGAFLSMMLISAIAICVLQHRWFNKLLKSKDMQIKRADDKEKEVFKRLMACLDHRK